MSVKFARAVFNRSESNREYKIRMINFNYPLYWDEGIHFRAHGLMPYQWRMYKTWKYNRKTKYKQI